MEESPLSSGQSQIILNLLNLYLSEEGMQELLRLAACAPPLYVGDAATGDIEVLSDFSIDELGLIHTALIEVVDLSWTEESEKVKYTKLADKALYKWKLLKEQRCKARKTLKRHETT